MFFYRSAGSKGKVQLKRSREYSFLSLPESATNNWSISILEMKENLGGVFKEQGMEMPDFQGMMQKMSNITKS